MVTVSTKRYRYVSDSTRHDIAEYVRSSPARLIAMSIVLLTLSLLAGGVTAQNAADRQRTLQTLLDHSEPFLNSTQQLYAALSTADALAGTSFLYEGQEPKAVRDGYTAAVDHASTELAAGGYSDDNAMARSLRRGIAAQIPVYTGLVETGRADDRIGLPVGAAYLAEASHLMQSTMLPMAQNLHKQQADAVAATERGIDTPPWGSAALLLVALIGLGMAQQYLARHWRRRLNAGFLAATIALVVLFAWGALAGTLSASSTADALERGTIPLSTLDDSRILVEQARAAETLKLVRHDTSTEYDQAFDTAVGTLQPLLNHYPTNLVASRSAAAARAGLARWLPAHRRMSDSAASGDFTKAAIIAIGPGPNDATAQFHAVDSALSAGITATRAELRDDLAHSADTLSLLDRGAWLLGGVAALAIGAGIWPRLREYR